MDARDHTGPLSAVRLALLTGGALLLVLCSAWYVHERLSRALDREKNEQGALLLDVAEKGMRAHIRGGRYAPEYMEDWFIGLMEAARLRGFRLDDGSGAPMAALGLLAEPDANADDSQGVMIARTLPELNCLNTPRFGQGGGRGGGRGMGPGMGRGMGPGMGMGQGWISLPEGPYTFRLLMDARPWLERETLLRQQLALGVLLALACIGLVLAMVRMRARQARLREDLRAAKARAERQAMLAQLGAGLAHETKNPLGVIRGRAQAMLDAPGLDAVVRKQLLDMVDETDRVVGQLDRFLSFSRPVEPDIAPTPLNDLFANLADLLRDEMQSARLQWHVEANGLTVQADAALLRRALLNLLLNAVKACGEGGAIFLRADAEDRRVCVSVRDTGCGMSPEDLARAATPYFSRFEGGVGLGLALTDEIARAHGWQLQLDSAPGQGTTARLSGMHAAGDES